MEISRKTEVFKKDVKPFLHRTAIAISQDPFLYIPTVAFFIILMDDTSNLVYSLIIILPFFLISLTRSILISLNAIQQITIREDEVEIRFLFLDKQKTLFSTKGKFTFIDFDGYRYFPNYISFFVNSKKEFSQYFGGQFRNSEFDSMRQTLAENGIFKPYGYNL